MSTVIISVTESGIRVPPESCAILGLQPGDDVEISVVQQAADRTVAERQLEVAKRIMVKRREVLKRLAE